MSQLQHDKKLLINTINAHSFNTLQHDIEFVESLQKSDILLPDGVSIVWAVRLLQGIKIKKIAGEDLFYYQMNRLQQSGGSCLFLGSSQQTLDKIIAKSNYQFPGVTIYAYSPPYKSEFSEEDNLAMVTFINNKQPDVLFVGMTAPKQEKWAYKHYHELNVGHVCCIGAVFDFYAGTVKRAPRWMIKMGLEWFYRFIKEPKRMWKRYLIGNVKFAWFILREKFSND